MKRLLPLFPLAALLLTTMGVGPCDSQPLGSVDDGGQGGGAGKGGGGKAGGTGGSKAGGTGGSKAGGTGGAGSVCFDINGNAVYCGTGGTPSTVDAGADAGFTCYDANGFTAPCPTDGGSSFCTDADGNYFPVGASFPCGCTICTCTSTGIAAPTTACFDAGTEAGAICFDSNGNAIPCGSDAGVFCSYNGVVYLAGASFPSTDGCNTCSCTTTGMVACTEKACADSGAPTDAATDGPLTCFDAAGVIVPCTTTDGGPADCSYDGVSYPVGSKFTCSLSSSCSLCYCAPPGQVTTDCSDELPVCAFDAVYVYGRIGSLTLYNDQVTLTPPASYVLVRTPTQGANAPGGSCAPALPTCNTGPLDVSSIMKDIADPTVQLLLSLSTTQPTVVGLDERGMDGSVFSFKKSGSAGFLVGAPCLSGSDGGSCVAIPAGVTNLMDDLMKLDQQQYQDPSCAAFMP